MMAKQDSKTIRIQDRDIVILQFLDKVGYANINQITISLNEDLNDTTINSVKRRLNILSKNIYLKIFSTQHGNYYALAKNGRLENQIITSIKFDQLPHHDYLTNLFLFVYNNPKCFQVLSERQVIASYKTVGKNGKVPDMIINDWIIEYERSNKSVSSSIDVVDYWTSREGRNLCVIYDKEEIRNRYSKILNPRVKLLSSLDYKDIFEILGTNRDDYSLQNSKTDVEFLNSIKNKYL